MTEQPAPDIEQPPVVMRPATVDREIRIGIPGILEHVETTARQQMTTPAGAAAVAAPDPRYERVAQLAAELRAALAELEQEPAPEQPSDQPAEPPATPPS